MTCEHEPLELRGRDGINLMSMLHVDDFDAEVEHDPITGKCLNDPRVHIRLCEKCRLVYWAPDEITGSD